MSRGPGRIERIVEQTLHDTDRSFTVEELAKLAYPTITDVQKKHRVAVLRAINKVAKQMLIWTFRTYTPPWRCIFTVGNNVRSYAHGLLRHSWWNAERSLDEIEKILADPEIKSVMEPGGFWWAVVEENQVEAEYNRLLKIGEAAGLIKRNEYKGIAPACGIADLPPELKEAGKWLDAARHYRLGLAKDCDTHTLLGRFEPPGTPVFEYAMKQRDAA
jgi:hypothetical protein